MNEDAYRASRIFRALGNPLRYRILACLAASPATPGELAGSLRRPVFTISHHLALLRALDLVWYLPLKESHRYFVKYYDLSVLLQVAERCVEKVREQGPDDSILKLPRIFG